LTLESAGMKVKEVGHPGGWDWDRMQVEFPNDIKRAIQATPIPLAARTEDKLAWKLSSKGEFDLKTAYSLTLPNLDVPFGGR